MAAQIKELVTYVAQALVDEPEAVEVTQQGSEGDVTLELQVAADDRGKVIGKKGRVAHTMRTLLHAAAGEDQNVSLEIVD
jgi:predicted RNA-binding protein YlqC (UPF0109 family)